jgi:predicted metal-dependent TIM-barrel fold hydrolase
LAIPFWVVGHIHLTINIYEDLYEILASFGMNIIVAMAFWLDWREQRTKK